MMVNKTPRPSGLRHSANERRMSGITLARDRRQSSSSARGTATTRLSKESSSSPVVALDDNDDNDDDNDDNDDDNDGHVRVAVRCRPMSEKELRAGHESIVEFESDRRLVVHDVSESPGDQLGTASGERRNISHVYDFDRVFGPQSSQLDIYDQVCRPLVSSVLAGYNGTIFAYGQTGTGKTYTMEGQQRDASVAGARKERSSAGNSVEDAAGGPHADGQATSLPPSAGIIPRTFEQIFDHIHRCRDVQFLVRASYLEIYQEEIRDLLVKSRGGDKRSAKLELHERADIGVYVKDLTSFVCKSVAEIERVMRVGNQNRMVGATDMNEHSSRSHAIFMITIEQQPNGTQSISGGGGGGSKSGNGCGGGAGGVIKVGKLNLVDLAGSERQRKTNSHGQRQQESIKINLSLSALGNVINSLMKLHNREQRQQQQQQQLQQSNNKSTAPPNSTPTTTAQSAMSIHTPYRDSKLTRLLQDSLGGNAKTLMIANIGPASYNYDETINTLNYASRARCIRNRPRLNEDPKDALLRELQREISLLRARLLASTAGRRSSAASKTTPLQQPPKEQQQQQQQQHGQDDRLIESEFLELKQKLASLECKLLNGEISIGPNNESSTSAASTTGLSSGVDLLADYTQRQELELGRRRDELNSQYGRQRAIQDELERREEAELVAKQSFQSIREEVEAKRRLIRQILFKAKAAHDKLQETQRACRLELDDLDQLQYVLQKELKLKCLVMDNFIPNSHVDQLLPRIVYDERRNCCSISSLQMAPLDGEQHSCHCPGGHGDYQDYWRPATGDSIRPRSEFERISEAIYPSNIRYKYENLIEPKLEILPWTGCKDEDRDLVLQDTEFGGPQKPGNGSLQAMISRALDEREPDIVI